MVDSVNKGINKSMGLIAVCGNPNCGKTTVFNAITGLNQKVGNYSGVTVEKVTGTFKLDSSRSDRFTLIDIPGTYSLSAFSPDEYIAASSLYSGIVGERLPDSIICVIDATTLERSLYLLLQVLQIGKPVVVAINMIDIAQRHGHDIDCEVLSQQLGGLPVIPVVANRGIGISQLKVAAAQATENREQKSRSVYPKAVESIVSRLLALSVNGHKTRAEMLRVLFDIDSPAEAAYLAASKSESQAYLVESREQLKAEFGTLTAAETIVLTKVAAGLTARALKKRDSKTQNRSDKIDRFLLHPVLGPILLMLIMLTVFQSIFSWAEPLITWVDIAFSSLATWIGSGMSEGPLRSLITDGIIGGVGAVLVFVPQIAILFLFIALLEDSGYMSRAAFLVDRMFRWCGLSGKSFIPLLSSFACAIPGIMATRTIEDRKLRLITIAVAPLMSCSARLPVYTILIAAFIPYERIFGPVNLQGLVLTALYAVGIVVAIIISFILKKTILKTEIGTFLMEMPGYKIPTLKSVVIRVFSRVRIFVTRAGTVILAIAIIIWALSYFPRSEFIASKYVQLETIVQERYDRLWPFHNSEIMSLVVQDETLNAINIDLTERFATAENRTAVEQIISILPPSIGPEKELADQLAARRLVEIAYQADLAHLANERAGENLSESYFGQFGRFVAPLFAPLGWDWKISMAVLASFPAREVVIATLGTIYNLGSEIDEESGSLVDKMRSAKWKEGAKVGQPVFTPAVAMSVMVFFALCCQCGATLVTIKQETGSYLFPVAVFGYMTVLAYLGSLAVYNFAEWVWF